MKISTRKLLASLSGRTNFHMVEPVKASELTEECRGCGHSYKSEDTMLLEDHGACVCMNCQHDILQAVFKADDASS